MGRGLRSGSLIAIPGVAKAWHLWIWIALEIDRERIDGLSVSIHETRLVEISTVITQNLANDEIIAKERHVPIALFDQGVIAPSVDKGIDASSTRDLVVAKSTVECVVEVRSDQTVVPSASVEGDRQ